MEEEYPSIAKKTASEEAEIHWKIRLESKGNYEHFDTSTKIKSR